MTNSLIAFVPLRMRSFMRASISFGVMAIIGLVIAMSAVAEAPMGPEELVRQTSQKLTAMIDDQRATFATNPEPLYASMTRLLEPVIDFESIARGVMGLHYRAATEAHRARFATIFKTSLVQIYADALVQLLTHEITFVPPDERRKDAKRRTVTMSVRLKDGEAVSLIYSMVRDDGGNWKVRNMILEGVNIGLVYRNQFSGAMSRREGDLDEVIDGWESFVREAQLAPKDK